MVGGFLHVTPIDLWRRCSPYPPRSNFPACAHLRLAVWSVCWYTPLPALALAGTWQWTGWSSWLSRDQCRALVTRFVKYKHTAWQMSDFCHQVWQIPTRSLTNVGILSRGLTITNTQLDKCRFVASALDKDRFLVTAFKAISFSSPSLTNVCSLSELLTTPLASAPTFRSTSTTSGCPPPHSMSSVLTSSICQRHRAWFSYPLTSPCATCL